MAKDIDPIGEIKHMSDLIDRQAAIDAIHNYFRNGLNAEPTRIMDGYEVYVDMKSVNKKLYDNKNLSNAIKALPSAEQEIKPITYCDCANAMLMMWMDNIVTDGEYNRIMDRLNARQEAD